MSFHLYLRMLIRFIFYLCFVSTIFAQNYNFSGHILDSETHEPLWNANIFISADYGTSSDQNGKFVIRSLPEANYKIKISSVGYQSHTIKLLLSSNIDTIIYLESEAITLGETIVISKAPVFRETPIAFNKIEKSDYELTLGQREAVDIIENVPNVYVTQQGGGIGEQRLNIRGFDQTNIAVMLNGIILNNPENGEVYWSNWTGISDIINYVSVQRGLSAIPYSTSSIGGSVNFITLQNKIQTSNFNYSTTVGSDKLYKYSLNFNASFSENLSITGLVSRKTSDGFADQVFAEETTYYLGLNYLNNNHNLQLQILGSPQIHGQRLTQLTIDEWKKYGSKFNYDWGYLNGKKINLRDNEFHNPTLHLNHIWTIKNNLVIKNIFSISRGNGGGTVPPWYPELSRTDEGLVDFDSAWELNNSNGDTMQNQSLIALRKGIHKNIWTTWISSIEYEIENYKITFGVDAKYYDAENYNELSNLLGGDYYLGSGDVNSSNLEKLYLGDKVDFYADSFTRNIGGFAQAEYQSQNLTSYLNLAYSNTNYKRIDHFNYLTTDPNRETNWKSFDNLTLKFGLNYNFNSENNIYVNIGAFSKAPPSQNVFDYSNNEYENVKNENIVSLELGYGFKSENTKINLNTFYTKWKDKASSQTFLSNDSTSLYYINLFGANATHFGVEFEGEYQLSRKLSLEAVIGYSLNKWDNDINSFVRPEADPTNEIEYYAYTDGLYVGNFPMTTVTLSSLYKDSFLDNARFYISPVFNFYGRYYAKFSPFSRVDIESKNIQPWRIPDFTKLDLHFGFEFKFENLFIKSSKISLHIFNLLNNKNIIDATDGLDHSTESALVWYNRDRWWNLSLSLNF